MQYAVMDIANMNLTTDNYIDKFLPFKIIKDVVRFFRLVLPQEQMTCIEELERVKYKQLYKYLT